MEISELLDKARENAGLQSDYELAKRIGFSRAALSKWRNELGAPDTTGALRLAALAGLPEQTAVAACELARSRDPEARAFWSRMGGWRKR